MSVTRPAIAALITFLFLAGCATSGNVITNEGLTNPNSALATSHSHDDTQWMEFEGAAAMTPLEHLSTGQLKTSWQLGEPDLIVKLRAPYSLPLEDSDVFRNFVIPNVTASDGSPASELRSWPKGSPGDSRRRPISWFSCT